MMHALDLDMLPFVGESLGILRKEVGDTAAVLGFVGAPWTLATYIVEGGSSSTYKTIKSMAMSDPETLKSILSAVADAVGDYVGYQIDAGAQCVQIFDSWGGQLPPHMWEVWSKPYIQRVVDKVRLTHPGVPLTLYANGSGGLLERMATTGVDCIGLDWTIDMEDGPPARRRLGGAGQRRPRGSVRRARGGGAGREGRLPKGGAHRAHPQPRARRVGGDAGGKRQGFLRRRQKNQVLMHFC
jgi:uroporphyrinogen decarboxylase